MPKIGEKSLNLNRKAEKCWKNAEKCLNFPLKSWKNRGKIPEQVD